MAGTGFEDGFAIASEGEVSVDDDAVAAGAVRMMIQVRAMSKALGQSGASQMFLEGSDSGICVIDKDPWVLVVVGAPGVPIGLLRYEAREIAEAFPMGQRPAPTASPESTEDDEPESASQADWAVVNTGTFLADEFVEEQSADLSAADDFVTTRTAPRDPLGRRADYSPEAGFGDDFLTADPVAAFATPDIAVEEQPAPNDFADWTSPAWLTCPAIPCSTCRRPRPMFRCPSRCLSRSTTQWWRPGRLVRSGSTDGDPIDLPPPMGPAFELPPPE